VPIRAASISEGKSYQAEEPPKGTERDRDPSKPWIPGTIEKI